MNLQKLDQLTHQQLILKLKNHKNQILQIQAQKKEEIQIYYLKMHQSINKARIYALNQINESLLKYFEDTNTIIDSLQQNLEKTPALGSQTLRIHQLLVYQLPISLKQFTFEINQLNNKQDNFAMLIIKKLQQKIQSYMIKQQQLITRLKVLQSKKLKNDQTFIGLPSIKIQRQKEENQILIKKIAQMSEIVMKINGQNSYLKQQLFHKNNDEKSNLQKSCYSFNNKEQQFQKLILDDYKLQIEKKNLQVSSLIEQCNCLKKENIQFNNTFYNLKIVNEKLEKLKTAFQLKQQLYLQQIKKLNDKYDQTQKKLNQIDKKYHSQKLQSQRFLQNYQKQIKNLERNNQILFTQNLQLKSKLDHCNNVSLQQKKHFQNVFQIQEKQSQQINSKISSETIKQKNSLLFEIKILKRDHEKEINQFAQVQKNNQQKYNILNQEYQLLQKNNVNITKTNTKQKKQINEKQKIIQQLKTKTQQQIQFTQKKIKDFDKIICFIKNDFLKYKQIADRKFNVSQLKYNYLKQKIQNNYQPKQFQTLTTLVAKNSLIKQLQEEIIKKEIFKPHEDKKLTFAIVENQAFCLNRTIMQQKNLTEKQIYQSKIKQLEEKIIYLQENIFTQKNAKEELQKQINLKQKSQKDKTSKAENEKKWKFEEQKRKIQSQLRHQKSVIKKELQLAQIELKNKRQIIANFKKEIKQIETQNQQRKIKEQELQKNLRRIEQQLERQKKKNQETNLSEIKQINIELKKKLQQKQQKNLQLKKQLIKKEQILRSQQNEKKQKEINFKNQDKKNQQYKQKVLQLQQLNWKKQQEIQRKEQIIVTLKKKIEESLKHSISYQETKQTQITKLQLQNTNLHNKLQTTKLQAKKKEGKKCLLSLTIKKIFQLLFQNNLKVSKIKNQYCTTIKNQPNTKSTAKYLSNISQISCSSNQQINVQINDPLKEGLSILQISLQQYYGLLNENESIKKQRKESSLIKEKKIYQQKKQESFKNYSKDQQVYQHFSKIQLIINHSQLTINEIIDYFRLHLNL